VSRDNLDENGGGNWSLKLLTLIVARQNVTTLLSLGVDHVACTLHSTAVEATAAS
jgi:hypothetical protein